MGSLRAASRLSFNGLPYVLDDDPRLLAYVDGR